MKDYAELLRAIADRWSLNRDNARPSVTLGLIRGLLKDIDADRARMDALEVAALVAKEAEDEAKDAFWAIYPEWCAMKGHGLSTEAARTALAARAQAAEAERDGLREALDLTAGTLRNLYERHTHNDSIGCEVWAELEGDRVLAMADRHLRARALNSIGGKE